MKQGTHWENNLGSLPEGPGRMKRAVATVFAKPDDDTAKEDE